MLKCLHLVVVTLVILFKARMTKIEASGFSDRSCIANTFMAVVDS